MHRYKFVSTDEIQNLIRNKDVLFEVTIENGEILQLSGKWLLINAITLRPLLCRDIQIPKDLILNDVLLTARVIADTHTRVFRTIVDNAQYNTEHMAQIKREIIDNVNTLYNIGVAYLGSHHKTMSGVSIANLVAIGNIKDTSTLDKEKLKTLSIAETEQLIQRTYAATYKEIDRVPKDLNILYPYVTLNILSMAQLSQVIVAGGTRTDVDDSLILKPISSGYIHGLKDIHELAIDSLSGKKAVVYNIIHMPCGQYSNRKTQLLGVSVEKLYPGDCGSTTTVPFEVTKDNAKHVVGNFIIEDNCLKELTKQNIPEYINKVVHTRSPLTCLHANGVCHICGGRTLMYQPQDHIPGIASAQIMMGRASQLILQTKHFSTTNSIEHILPLALFDYLIVQKNDIYFRDNINMSKLTIGVPYNNMARIGDIEHLSNSSAVSDRHFSNVTHLSIAHSQTGEIIGANIPMSDSNKSTPYFTDDILEYIKDNPDLICVGDTIWIDLSKFDKSKPVLRTTIVNDSMVKFVKEVELLFTSNLRRYKSATKALRDLSNHIYKKVDCNICHIAIVLRSAMITSTTDFRMPICTDPENVCFGTLTRIIPRRHLGGQMAFQGFAKFIITPDTYIHPRPSGPFDVCLGYTTP
jgi:hypothetical protein